MATNYEALLRGYREVNDPVLMFGPPGIGKSELAAQIAGEDPLIDLRLSLLDPVDLRGLPMIVEKHLENQLNEQVKDVKWARPEFIPPDGKGVLLLDELNTSAVAVMNAGLQLVLDRRVGPHILGDGWWIIACCNKAEHGAHVNPISAPLRSRFNILNMEPDIHTWTRWAMNNDIDQRIIGFLNFRTEYLYVAPSDEYDNFPNPRGWARLSTMLNSKNKLMDCSEVVTARVGSAASTEFQAYRAEIKKMPNIDKLLSGDEKFTHGEKVISISYAVTLAIGNRVVKDVALIEPACRVMEQIPTEIAALFFTQVLSQDNNEFRLAMIKSPGVKHWVEKHARLLRKYGFQG